MKTTYTEQENEFLKKHYDSCSWETLTKMLNQQFGTQRKYRTVKTHCRTVLHLKKELPQSNYRNNSRYNIGDEIIENGYVLVKISAVKGSRQQRSRSNWIQKQRLIWEQHHGKIPDNHFVIFLDGNHFNFNIDNLYCVPSQIIGILNQNGWIRGNKELTLTAIKLCELMGLLK